MNEKNTGGPAFPGKVYTGQVEYVAGVGNNHVMEDSPGMDLRDYFAAKAMQSMLLTVRREQDVDLISKAAYSMADAMLEARK